MIPPRRGRTAPASSGSLAASVGQVAVGSMIANVCAYLIHLPASRWLPPDSYGEFAVLLQATLVLGVPALALQAVVAREVVSGRQVRSLIGLGGRTACVIAVVAAIAVVPMSIVARTGIAATAAAFAVAPLLVLIAVGQGIAQGRGEFGRLAWVIGAVGVVRAVPPVVVLALGGGPAAALTAAMVGAFVAVGVVWSQAGVGASWTELGHRSQGVRPSAVLQASWVQFVVIAATSVDLLFARIVLTENDSGVYALGTIASKVAFWLPQAIGLVLYPRLADAQRSAAALRTGVLVLVGLSAVTVAAALLGGPAVPVVIGDDYRPVAGLLWLFAITGGALAVLQVALLTAIARDRTAVAAIPAAVIVAEALLILGVAHSVLTLAVIAALCALVAASMTVVVTMRTRWFT